MVFTFQYCFFCESPWVLHGLATIRSLVAYLHKRKFLMRPPLRQKWWKLAFPPYKTSQRFYSWSTSLAYIITVSSLNAATHRVCNNAGPGKPSMLAIDTSFSYSTAEVTSLCTHKLQWHDPHLKDRLLPAPSSSPSFCWKFSLFLLTWKFSWNGHGSHKRHPAWRPCENNTKIELFMFVCIIMYMCVLFCTSDIE